MPIRRHPLPDWVLERRRELGQRIADYRRAARLSQDQLAQRVGVERRTIQRYESGERDPRFVELLLISEAVGMTAEDLICNEGPGRPYDGGGDRPGH